MPIQCPTNPEAASITDLWQNIYSPARLNLLLAQIHKSDRFASEHAYECIDLLDLYRQKYPGRYDAVDEDVFTCMEDASKDVIDHVAEVSE